MLEPGKIYEFAEFRLDTAKEVLERNGANVAITKKMFETLRILVENSERLVEKQELMERIWHDRFVEESNLTFNIKMLRKALGDSAANPTFIQTIPRRGYQFIAEVTQPADKPAPAAAAAAARDAKPVFVGARSGAHLLSKRPYLFGLIASMVLLGSLGFASMIWQKAFLKSETGVFAFGFHSEKITYTGKVHNAVISPDGKYVAYTNVTNGKQGLWLRHLESANNTPILPASDDIYYGLTFSNDGNTLYFVRGTNTDAKSGPATIYRVPVSGGLPVKLVEDVQGWISVSPDEKRISFVRSEFGPIEANRLFVIDIEGGNEREIKTSSSPNLFWANAFSPDGKSIAAVYGHSSNASQQMGLVEINLETGEQREIMPEKFFHIQDVEWVSDKRALLFSADKNIGETSKIWQVDHVSGQVRPVTSDLTNYGYLSLSRRADMLLAISFWPDFQLSIRGPGGSGKALTQARDRFAFTPDGKIVYASDTAGNEDIWIMDADGSNPRQLTNDQGLDFFPIVAPDGHQIYFTSNRTGESQAWRMNIDGSNQTQLTRRDGGYPRFVTPDNKTLYYQSALTNKLMIASLETGEETPFGSESGYFQSFTPDGSLLGFLSSDPGTKVTTMTILDVGTKETLRTFTIPPGKETPYFLRWRDNETIGYVMNANDGDDSIWLQHIRKDAPQLLYKVGDEGLMDFQFSPVDNSVGLIRGNWKQDAVLLTGLN